MENNKNMLVLDEMSEVMRNPVFRAATQPQGYKTFLCSTCSTQLSMKFQLLIKTKIKKNKDFLLSNSQMLYFHANKC